MGYWENETPKIVKTERNVFKLFEGAKKLQVSSPDWLDAFGKTQHGKTVAINLEALRKSEEAREWLISILNDLS